MLWVLCVKKGFRNSKHEEGATTVTTDNVLGPILALVVIILAIVVAKRIKKSKIENNYGK